MGKDAQLAVASSFTFDREAVVFPRNIWKKTRSSFCESNRFSLPRKRLGFSTIVLTNIIVLTHENSKCLNNNEDNVFTRKRERFAT